VQIDQPGRHQFARGFDGFGGAGGKTGLHRLDHPQRMPMSRFPRSDWLGSTHRRPDHKVELVVRTVAAWAGPDMAATAADPERLRKSRRENPLGRATLPI
jgi:hypothetical protein